VGGRGEVFQHGQELEDRVSPADGVLSHAFGSVSIHDMRCFVHAEPNCERERRPAGTHPSPSQILSELLARALLPGAP
jgi:hypothetical protein